MRTPIEFAPSATTTETTTPWATPKKTSYEDLLLKPEYATRRLKFPVGQTWMRIVPAIQPSVHGWMMPLHVLGFEGGRCNHPKTHRKNGKSCFDHAYAWMKDQLPDGLYSKANKAGVRLLTDPMSLFWCIVEEGGLPVARLILASGYDGSRGGAAGLGHEFWRLTCEKDEEGNLIADVIDPAAGRRICVEKTQPTGAKYPSYTLRVGRQPAPMDALLAEMDPEEVAALCPLEEVVRQLSDEEEWQCLGRVIAPENVALIQASLK